MSEDYIVIKRPGAVDGDLGRGVGGGMWGEGESLCHLRTHSHASVLHNCLTDASVLLRATARAETAMMCLCGWGLIDGTIP